MSVHSNPNLFSQDTLNIINSENGISVLHKHLDNINALYEIVLGHTQTQLFSTESESDLLDAIIEKYHEIRELDSLESNLINIYENIHHSNLLMQSVCKAYTRYESSTNCHTTPSPLACWLTCYFARSIYYSDSDITRYLATVTNLTRNLTGFANVRFLSLFRNLGPKSTTLTQFICNILQSTNKKNAILYSLFPSLSDYLKLHLYDTFGSSIFEGLTKDNLITYAKGISSLGLAILKLNESIDIVTYNYSTEMGGGRFVPYALTNVYIADGITEQYSGLIVIGSLAETWYKSTDDLDRMIIKIQKVFPDEKLVIVNLSGNHITTHTDMMPTNCEVGEQEDSDDSELSFAYSNEDDSDSDDNTDTSGDSDSDSSNSDASNSDSSSSDSDSSNSDASDSDSSNSGSDNSSDSGSDNSSDSGSDNTRNTSYDSYSPFDLPTRYYPHHVMNIDHSFSTYQFTIILALITLYFAVKLNTLE